MVNISTLKSIYPYIKELDEIQKIQKTNLENIKSQILIKKHITNVKQNLIFDGINFRTEKLQKNIDLSFLCLIYKNKISPEQIYSLEKLWYSFIDSNINNNCENPNEFSIESIKKIISSFSINFNEISEIFLQIIDYNIYDYSFKLKILISELNKLKFENEFYEIIIDSKIKRLKKILEIDDYIFSSGFENLEKKFPSFRFDFIDSEFTKYLEIVFKLCHEMYGTIDWIIDDGKINTSNGIGILVIFLIRKKLKINDSLIENLLNNLKYIFTKSWEEWLICFFLSLGIGISKSTFDMGLKYDNEDVCLHNVMEYKGCWKELSFMCVEKGWAKLLKFSFYKSFDTFTFEENKKILDLCKNSIDMTKILLSKFENI
jgi:hypothetical protein